MLILTTMVAARSLRRLTQAVLLALAAWVLTVGVASAHGGHESVDAKAPAVATLQTNSSSRADLSETAPDAQETAVAVADQSESSCPTGSPTKHAGCCTIACHAAMAAPAIDSFIGPKVASSLPADLSDMLEGRCGDRSERPPRLV